MAYKDLNLTFTEFISFYIFTAQFVQLLIIHTSSKNMSGLSSQNNFKARIKQYNNYHSSRLCTYVVDKLHQDCV